MYVQIDFSRLKPAVLSQEIHNVRPLKHEPAIDHVALEASPEPFVQRPSPDSTVGKQLRARPDRLRVEVYG